MNRLLGYIHCLCLYNSVLETFPQVLVEPANLSRSTEPAEHIWIPTKEASNGQGGLQSALTQTPIPVLQTESQI